MAKFKYVAEPGVRIRCGEPLWTVLELSAARPGAWAQTTLIQTQVSEGPMAALYCHRPLVL